MTSQTPSHYATLPVIRMMEQADIDRQRATKRETARRVEADPVARAHQWQLKRNLSWMNEHDRSRRILPRVAFKAWREAFGRTAKMYKHMPDEALTEVLDRLCRDLSLVMSLRHESVLVWGKGCPPPIMTGDRAADLHRAFQSVHSALRQLDVDSTTTTIAHLAHCMAKLKATSAGDVEYFVRTGVEVEQFAQFAYPDEL